MALLDRLFRRSTGINSETNAIPLSVNTWDYKRFNGDVLTMDLIVASIDALSRNIAKTELKSVVNRKDAKEIDRTSDVARVLKKPNKYMSTYDFMYKVSALYFTNNNVFIYPEYDPNGNLVALYPINYQTFHLYRTDRGTLIAQFQLNYFKEYTCPYDRLIHLRNHYIGDDLFGEDNNALTPASELLNAQNQGIIEGIKNSAIIRGVLKSVNVIKQADLVKARDQFVQDNLRASNNGGVIVVDGKFDYQNLENRPYVVDSETMEQAKAKVFDYFGVNEAFLQNSFNSDGFEAVYEGRLEPFAIMLSQALTDKLFTERERGFGNEIEANMSRVKYQSMTTVVSIINATNQLGLFTRDEYREMLGYAPLGEANGGNDIMVALNNYGKDGENEQ